jgi:hypothetical protein
VPQEEEEEEQEQEQEQEDEEELFVDVTSLISQRHLCRSSIRCIRAVLQNDLQ